MISEKTFKTALNGMWYTFANSAALINRLEGMGLHIQQVPQGQSDGSDGFGCLIGMQARTDICIMQLLGIDKKAGGSREGVYLSEEIDQYLTDVYSQYPECSLIDTFPKECYAGLLETIKDAGVTLPWEKEES